MAKVDSIFHCINVEVVKEGALTRKPHVPRFYGLVKVVSHQSESTPYWTSRVTVAIAQWSFVQKHYLKNK